MQDNVETKEEVKSDVSRLQANVKNLTQKTVEINDSLKSLQVRVTKSKTTNWSVIASMIGVALTIISMIGYLAMEPIIKEIETLRRWKSSAIKELAMLGKYGAVHKERIRALERSEFDEPKDQ